MRLRHASSKRQLRHQRADKKNRYRKNSGDQLAGVFCCPDTTDGLWPSMFVRELRSEDRLEDLTRVIGAHDRIDLSGYGQWSRELTVSAITVAETERTLPRQVTQQDVGFPENRHRVKEVQCFRPGQVALPGIPRQTAVLPPLDVDKDL